jgi:hypothetical protein
MAEWGEPEDTEGLVNSSDFEVRGRALMAAAAVCSGTGYDGYKFAMAIKQAEKYLRTGASRG